MHCPLLQLAERCRVLVDADVADMRRRAASSHQEAGPCNPTSVWAVPLGRVMQVRQTLSSGSGPAAVHRLPWPTSFMST